MNLPFAQAADQNKEVIHQAVNEYLVGRVLEIGSGTGQHAVYFAGLRPDLNWQTSDMAGNLPGIRAWCDDAGLANLMNPIVLDVDSTWPNERFDTVYGANIFHIMGEASVASCIAGSGRCLNPGGHLIVYGPFNYSGEYTSASNARFDAMLRAGDPASGIRDFDWLDDLARAAGLMLEADIAMPANNRSLIWQKRT